MIVLVKIHPTIVFVYLRTLVNFMLLIISISNASIRFSSRRAQLDIISGSWENVCSTTLPKGNLVHTLASTFTRLDAEIFQPFEFCQ
jgi:hypothetical protein